MAEKLRQCLGILILVAAHSFFTSTSFSQTSSVTGEGIYKIDLNSDEYPLAQMQLNVMDGMYTMTILPDKCDPITYTNGQIYYYEGPFYKQSITQSASPASTCSGHQFRGATSVDIGPNWPNYALTKIYTVDFEIEVPELVTLSQTTVYTDYVRNDPYNGVPRTWTSAQTPSSFGVEVEVAGDVANAIDVLSSCTLSGGSFVITRVEPGAVFADAKLIELNQSGIKNFQIKCTKPITRVLSNIAKPNNDTWAFNPSLIKSVTLSTKASQKLCKVADKGRNVEFQYQTNPLWINDPFGIPALSSKPGTMGNYGCSLTDLAMLFKSYGITSTPLGSPANPSDSFPFYPLPGLDGEPLTPGSLNKALANYKTTFIAPLLSSVGFQSHNNPNWTGAAEVARAGYRAQCQSPSSLCDPNNAVNIVSYKKSVSGWDEQAQKAVEDEICAGNPVILRFSKANDPKGQHFMLATGYGLDGNGNKRLILQNPGTRLGRDQIYEDELQTNYPQILGYVLYRPSKDPSMMFITAPMNVNFVVTDPQGRKTGYDPIAKIRYNQIPGADYTDQSIDTPNEDGFTPSTLVRERYFSSSEDVPNGSYQVQVFAEQSGDYYLDYRSFDSTGTTNDSVYRTGNLMAGNSTTVTFAHDDKPAAIPNADLRIQNYVFVDPPSKQTLPSKISLIAKVTPRSNSPIKLESSFKMAIGGHSGYQLSVPATQFKVVKNKSNKIEKYLYQKDGVEIDVSANGEMNIHLSADLSRVVEAQKGIIEINIDSVIGGVNLPLKCNSTNCRFEDSDGGQ